MKVRSKQDAWNAVDEIFPTDYEKDEASSERAGYPIYRSAAEGYEGNYICDLNDRLEINLADNRTINVWIEEETEDPYIRTAIEATRATKELAEKLSPLYEIKDYKHVVLVVAGSMYGTSEAQRKVYAGLKAGVAGLAGDLIARWCEANDLKWSSITNTKTTHYNHKEGAGHFIMEAFVGIRKEAES